MSTWIRNLKYLAPVSSIANLLVVAGYVATIYIMSYNLPPISERHYVAEYQSIPLFFGTVIYSFEAITLVYKHYYIYIHLRDIFIERLRNFK